MGGFIEEKGWAAFRREEVRVLGAILRGEGGGGSHVVVWVAACSVPCHFNRRRHC